MLSVIYGDKRDPYDVALEAIEEVSKRGNGKLIFRLGRDYFCIDSASVPTAENNLIERICQSSRKIESVRNYEKKAADTQNEEDNDVYVERKTGLNPSGERYRGDIEVGDLFMVDFGQACGGEFGFEHPAIVVNSPAKNLWNVIPLSTKLREGKEVLELHLDDPKVLENANELFLERSKGITSYVIINEKRAVSVKRFKTFLGRLSLDSLNTVLNNNADIKNLTLEKLNLTLEEKKFISEGRADKLLKIANLPLTTEVKVSKLLKSFGIDPKATKVNEVILKAVVEAKGRENFRLKPVCEKLSYGKTSTSSEISAMITAEIKHRIKFVLYPNAESFISLISKLAYARRVDV